MVEVRFTSQAQKNYDKLPEKSIRKRIIQAIRKLAQKPQSGKKLQGKLEGTYSLRVWPYRILYEFTGEKNILITDIGHRKDIYK